MLGEAGLAHRRLSIIDPIGGAQPLSDDGGLSVVFNGEIYNFRELRHELQGKGHRFKTDSDTEVVLRAFAEWGEKSLLRLRGMFAFAIWDEHRRRLFLARDRMGIKPLLYLETPSLFAFASEAQAFDVLDWDHGLDLDALDLYLHFQYIPAPYTAYKRVRKLPPAHYLIVDAHGIQGPTPYWRLEMRPNRRIPEGEWLERLDAGIADAVSSHLVSDVPFGAFLSGGVDSSTVVAYMRRYLKEPVRTFAIGFEDARYDESRYARRAADHLGAEHHEETIRPDAFELLPKLVRHYGEPFADSSALPTYYVSQLASRHVKMVLSGDGGDENFAGYTTYQNVLREHRPPQGTVGHARFAAGSMVRALGLRPALPRPENTWFDSVAYFGEHARRRLWRPEYQALAGGSRRWFEDQMAAAPSGDVCSRFQYVDLHTYLPNDILTKVDIASMCHGLEVRVPLLDHRLVELVAEIPWTLKLHAEPRVDPQQWPAYTTKYLLKKLAERFLPGDILHRPKQGFAVPIGEWIRALGADDIRARLAGPLTELLDAQTVDQFVSEHQAGTEHGPRLWSLLVLAEWLDQQRHRQARAVSA